MWESNYNKPPNDTCETEWELSLEYTEVTPMQIASSVLSSKMPLTN